jgi:hypothetical protein
MKLRLPIRMPRMPRLRVPPPAVFYDLFMLAGAGLVVAGVAVLWGRGHALLVAGLLVMGLTYFGARR